MKKGIFFFVILGFGVCSWLIISSCGHKQLAKGYSETLLNYDYVGDFNNGLALVERLGQWGFINEDGEEVIPCEYEMAGPFSSGRAYVLPFDDDKYHYIDENGNVTLTTDYEYVRSFTGNAAPVSHGQNWALIDKDGKELTDFIYTSFTPYTYKGKNIFVVQNEENRYGILDDKGRTILPCNYIWMGSFDKGLAALWNGNENRHTTGMVNMQGQIVVPFLYDNIDLCTENVARVEQNSKYGYVNVQGSVLAPCVYTLADNFFHDGRASVYRGAEDNLRQGFINSQGVEVIPCQYEPPYVYGEGGGPLLSSFSEGFAKVAKDGHFGFIDTKGKKLTPLDYDDARDFHRGIAAVMKDDKWGFIDTRGHEIIPCHYDNVSYESINRLKVTLDDRVLFFDKTGKPLVDEHYLPYDFVGEPIEELTEVIRNQRVGYVDEDGVEVIPCQYDQITPFHNGTAVGNDRGKYYLIKKEKV
ncbi:MAG: WG repeat-containing protein [Muribaculaceae bacterium]|nr:WG repeat-containing protein [Muribaculaceae bacterium]